MEIFLKLWMQWQGPFFASFSPSQSWWPLTCHGVAQGLQQTMNYQVERLYFLLAFQQNYVLHPWYFLDMVKPHVSFLFCTFVHHPLSHDPTLQNCCCHSLCVFNAQAQKFVFRMNKGVFVTKKTWMLRSLWFSGPHLWSAIACQSTSTWSKCPCKHFGK